MDVFAALQELSATVFGVNIAYLALAPLRHHQAISEHAHHILENAGLKNGESVPLKIVEKSEFRSTVYYCWKSANIHHIDAVVRYQKDEYSSESPDGPEKVIKYCDYKLINMPNLGESENKQFGNFRKELDVAQTKVAAFISMMLLIFAGFDQIFEALYKSWTLVAFYIALFVLLSCLLTPCYWIWRGKKLRLSIIAQMSQSADELYKFTWPKQEQITLQGGIGRNRPVAQGHDTTGGESV